MKLKVLFLLNCESPKYIAKLFFPSVYINVEPFQNMLKLMDMKIFIILHSLCLSGSMLTGKFCRLLITLANNLDPDQDRQNVGPDMDPNRLTL